MTIYADNAATTKMSPTSIRAMLPYMDPASAQYVAINGAAGYLESLLNGGNPSQNDLAAAMAALTQAMAGIY